MLCYRDMTFCPFSDKCAAAAVCRRALTDEVRIKAAEFGLDICQFLDKPDCFLEKVDKDDTDTV